MPIAIKTFINEIADTVASVDPRLQLNVNFGDDRIDYAANGVSGCFMSREDLDSCLQSVSLRNCAESRAECLKRQLDFK